jgi:hypothetical protein
MRGVVGRYIEGEWWRMWLQAELDGEVGGAARDIMMHTAFCDLVDTVCRLRWIEDAGGSEAGGYRMRHVEGAGMVVGEA